MKRAALVMGFGFGRANVDIAEFALQRNNMIEKGPFDWILSQDAVCQPLHERGLACEPMHGHHKKVYVDTLDAAAFGLLKLLDLTPEDEAVEVEVIAHCRQLRRAHDAAMLAVEYLSRKPTMAEFLQRVSLPELPDPAPMRMNRCRESWRQPWTCQHPAVCGL